MTTMRRLSILTVGVTASLSFTIVASAAPASKQTICHKPGTPAEATLSVSGNAVAAHLAHGDFLGPCVVLVDQIIDADGVASAQSGDPAAREVVVGDTLSTFPVSTSTDSGLDMFDQDLTNTWTVGDDLHSEGSACPTGIRDGIHQLGMDCKVLDINGDLANGALVSCDLEFGFGFTQTPCPPPNVKYHDTNLNGGWDSGEDIVLDVNNDGIFN